MGRPSAISGPRAGLDAAVHPGGRARRCGDPPRYAGVAWWNAESEPRDTSDAQRRVHGAVVPGPELPTGDAVRNLGCALATCATDFAHEPIPSGSLAGRSGSDASTGE